MTAFKRLPCVLPDRLGTRDHVRHPPHEPPGLHDRVRGPLRRYVGAGTSFVVRDRFEVVRRAQKSPQIEIEARIVLGEAPELALDPSVRFHELTGLLDDKGLRGMQPRQISRAAGFVRPTIQHPHCLRQAYMGLVHEQRRFRLHKSIPSRRISIISGVRSA